MNMHFQFFCFMCVFVSVRTRWEFIFTLKFQMRNEKRAEKKTLKQQQTLHRYGIDREIQIVIIAQLFKILHGDYVAHL